MVVYEGGGGFTFTSVFGWWFKKHIRAYDALLIVARPPVGFVLRRFAFHESTSGEERVLSIADIGLVRHSINQHPNHQA